MYTTPIADPAICAHCATVSPTCCRVAPGREEFCFPLSEIEMDRIRDHVPQRGWFAMEANTSEFRAHVARLFPGEGQVVEGLFPDRKHHYRLALGRDGACRFLNVRGCVLPQEARPYHCRLYPLWIGDDGPAVLDGDCLARREARGAGALAEALGTTLAKVRDLHARLRMAWGLAPAKGLPRAVVSYARTNR